MIVNQMNFIAIIRVDSEGEVLFAVSLLIQLCSSKPQKDKIFCLYINVIYFPLKYLTLPNDQNGCPLD